MKTLIEILHSSYFFCVFLGVDAYSWIALILAVLGVASYVIHKYHIAGN